VLRLAEDGSRKIPNFILRPLVKLIQAGKPYDAPALALAGWARFLTGADEQGRPIPLKDPDGGPVIAAAQRAHEDPAAFLRIAGLQGLSAVETTALAETFQRLLLRLRQRGVREILAAWGDKMVSVTGI
jgi:fructuronate reductase